MSKLTLRNYLDSSGNCCVDYQQAWDAMRDFTRSRSTDTDDEIWLLQHYPVYTLGVAGDDTHIINPGDIPVVKIDRGGQVTYHGPGQLMLYLLFDIARHKLGIRQIIVALENTVIDLLADYGLRAIGDRSAPGVYIEGKKIAALGLRVSKGRCYHGLCLNIDFDPSPFSGINPCGYEGMQVTQMRDWINDELNMSTIGRLLVGKLVHYLPVENTTELSQLWVHD